MLLCMLCIMHYIFLIYMLLCTYVTIGFHDFIVFFWGRDPGALKSDIVSKKVQSICSTRSPPGAILFSECMYVCMYVCMQYVKHRLLKTQIQGARDYICAYIYIYICMYVCIYIYIYIYMCVYIYIYIHLCMNRSLFIPCPSALFGTRFSCSISWQNSG